MRALKALLQSRVPHLDLSGRVWLTVDLDFLSLQQASKDGIVVRMHARVEELPRVIDQTIIDAVAGWGAPYDRLIIADSPDYLHPDAFKEGYRDAAAAELVRALDMTGYRVLPGAEKKNKHLQKGAAAVELPTLLAAATVGSLTLMVLPWPWFSGGALILTAPFFTASARRRAARFRASA
jgi:hypothetical protein